MGLKIFSGVGLRRGEILTPDLARRVLMRGSLRPGVGKHAAHAIRADGLPYNG